MILVLIKKHGKNKSKQSFSHSKICALMKKRIKSIRYYVACKSQNSKTSLKLHLRLKRQRYLYIFFSLHYING